MCQTWAFHRQYMLSPRSSALASLWDYLLCPDPKYKILGNSKISSLHTNPCLVQESTQAGSILTWVRGLSWDLGVKIWATWWGATGGNGTYILCPSPPETWVGQWQLRPNLQEQSKRGSIKGGHTSNCPNYPSWEHPRNTIIWIKGWKQQDSD